MNTIIVSITPPDGLNFSQDFSVNIEKVRPEGLKFFVTTQRQYGEERVFLTSVDVSLEVEDMDPQIKEKAIEKLLSVLMNPKVKGKMRTFRLIGFSEDYRPISWTESALSMILNHEYTKFSVR